MKRFSLLNEADGNTSNPDTNGNDGNGQDNEKLQLILEADAQKLRIIDDSKYITGIQPNIYRAIEDINSTTVNFDKKYFKKIELKPVGQVDIAKLFNDLQTTINTIEVYNNNGDVQRIKNGNENLTTIVANSETDEKGNIKFKPSGESNKEQTAKEKKTYEAQLANVKKVNEKLKSLKWSENNNIREILTGGFAVIRELMNDFQKLTKLSILSKNFYTNYNKNINLIVNAIKYTNAVESKDASIKNIESNIFNNSKEQYRMGSGKMEKIEPPKPINN